MTIEFDAADYLQQLEAAGVPRHEAEVHAKTLSLAFSTCAESRPERQALGEKFGARMDLFEARMVARMDAFECSVKLELAAMHTELAEMKQILKFHNWMFGVNSALLIALLVKTYFP